MVPKMPSASTAACFTANGSARPISSVHCGQIPTVPALTIAPDGQPVRASSQSLQHLTVYELKPGSPMNSASNFSSAQMVDSRCAGSERKSEADKQAAPARRPDGKQMKARLNYDHYLASHGKMPRGRGSWAFCPRAEYSSSDYLDHIVWVNGKRFSEAAADAIALFTSRGVGEIVVCP